MSQEEYEVVFLDIDPEAITGKLKKIGAEKEGEYFYRRRVFDYPDWRLDKRGAWLRLRDEGERVTLSYKERLGRTSDDGSTSDTGMKEVEVVVSDFDKTAALLFELGFIEKHYGENKRVRWVKEGVVFDIDTWPALETYLEIEANSWEKVDRGIEMLGLDPNEKKIFSTNQIYALKGIEVSDYSRLTFEGGLEKR